MKSLFATLICVLPMFSETYISGSIISNSVISDGNMGEKGSGVVISKTIIPKTSFNKIHIDTVANIEIRHSSTNSIVVNTDDNLINKVSIYTKNSTLFIKIKGSINPSKGLFITVGSQYLKSLIVDGVSDITVSGYSLDSLSLNIDGASDILFNSNNINKLYINADGSYDVNLLNSKIKEAYIKADGSGDIKINISKYMDVSVVGTAEVKYIGNPKIKKYIDGVADLTQIR